jgi:hypothetical protein
MFCIFLKKNPEKILTKKPSTGHIVLRPSEEKKTARVIAISIIIININYKIFVQFKMHHAPFH